MSAVSLFSQSDNFISQSITVDEIKRGLLFIVILTAQNPRNRDEAHCAGQELRGLSHWLKKPG